MSVDEGQVMDVIATARSISEGAPSWTAERTTINLMALGVEAVALGVLALLRIRDQLSHIGDQCERIADKVGL